MAGLECNMIKLKNIINEAWGASNLAKQGSRKAIYKFVYNDGKVATWFDDSYGKTYKSAQKELYRKIKDAKDWGWHENEQEPTLDNIGIFDTRKNTIHHHTSFKWKSNSVKINKDEHNTSTMTHLLSESHFKKK